MTTATNSYDSILDFENSVAKYLKHECGVLSSKVNAEELFVAVARTIREKLVAMELHTRNFQVSTKQKEINYLSAEFLTGRYLAQNLLSTKLINVAEATIKKYGFTLADIEAVEPEPGLGNGGLGRLAACFLDSMATLGIIGMGHGLEYEFGIFRQSLNNGWQHEHPEDWLERGSPWRIVRFQDEVVVGLGGHVRDSIDSSGSYKAEWIPGCTLKGIPNDYVIPSFADLWACTLRLWTARSTDPLDFNKFNAGDHFGARGSETHAKNITRVLYPNDQVPEGRELRLTQQYFFVSCAIQDIIRRHISLYGDILNLPEKVAIQLNDTHPSIAVVELMRILIDSFNLSWEVAWNIATRSFGYTNHTVMPEALEKWSIKLLGGMLPRHLQIIYEINNRFITNLPPQVHDNPRSVEKVSIFEESEPKQIRMANLACIGSNKVNGVAELHSQIISTFTFGEFARIWPQKFTSITNGVSPRRWLLVANPALSKLITSKIGTKWHFDLEYLKELENYLNDEEFIHQWQTVKRNNKKILGDLIKFRENVNVSINTIFDVQVKRIHEYKRQLMMALYIAHLYLKLKENPDLDVVPRTFIFGGKAAAAYLTAKSIIKLIWNIGSVINRDPQVNKKLSVVYIQNFNVTWGESIYPAADLSEQISTAGKEASGTGNMKFALNGALTIGTRDGATIEMANDVGEEYFFLFGHSAEEVQEIKAGGYLPRSIYEQNPDINKVISAILNNVFSTTEQDIFKPLMDLLLQQDEFLVLADLQSYIDCQAKVDNCYRDSLRWTKHAITNVARMGRFSSDRSIKEYCSKIWGL
jgi:glycogen phosphorylase